MRAMECSRKSCLVAMPRSGIWSLKEKKWASAGSGAGFVRLGLSGISLHFGICHEDVGFGVLFCSKALDPIVKVDRSFASSHSSWSASGAPVRKMQRPWCAIRPCSASREHHIITVYRSLSASIFSCENRNLLLIFV